MSDVKFVEFKDNHVSFNIMLSEEQLNAFKEEWSKVNGVQPPLVDVSRNGVNIFVPWIMGGQSNE